MTTSSFTTGSPSTTTGTSGIAAYALPYAQQNLANAWATSQQPYQAYQGQQNAAMTGLQNQSFEAAQNLGINPNTTAAGTAAGQATQNLLNTGYNPINASYQSVNAPSLNNYSMGTPMTSAAQTSAAQLGYAPTAQAQNAYAVNSNAAYGQAAQTGASPYMSAAQFQGPGSVGYNNVYSQGFNNQSAAQLMNPYLQQSLNPQIALLNQQQGMQQAQNQAQATQAGAFGGSRMGVQNALQNQSNQLAMSNLVGQGYNNAFNNAQQQFNTQNAASLQAQQANQAAGINTGQFNAQMGYNTGLQNAQLQQQAGLANQSLAGQYGLQNASMQQQTNMANAANQQQTNLANQSAQNQFGLSNQAAQNQFGLANQQMAGQYGLQQGQFNQAANLANQSAQQQANLANQQAGLTAGQANLGAQLSTQQLGAQQNLAAQQANQQAGLTAQQANINQQQYGAGLGLSANQAAISGANAQANIGQNQYAQQTGNIGLQNTLGAQQQQYQQGLLNTQYQNYVNQLNYPYQQQGYIQNMVNGYPVQSTQSTTQPSSPSGIQNIAALGVGAYGASQLFPNLGSSIANALTFADGGIMKSYKKGGMVDRYADSGLTSSITSPLATTNPNMLKKAIEHAEARGDTETATALQTELGAQNYATQQLRSLPQPATAGAPQAGSYGSNPQTASGLTGAGNGQRGIPNPQSASGQNTQSLPSLTDLIKMQNDANKVQRKAVSQPGQMAVADNTAYANAISDSPVIDPVMPTESKKRGGITDVARYKDDGVTTLGNNLPADIQNANMGNNTLDFGAPSTLNAVREDRGLPAVSVGQVRDVPNQETLTQANAEAQQLQSQSISSAVAPTTAKAAAQQGLSNLGLDFKQVPTLTYDEMVTKLGQRPTMNYDQLRTANNSIYGNPEDNARQNRAFAAFSALPGLLSGNQAGRGIAQGLSDFGTTATKMQEAEDRKRQATAEMNMKLNLAQHAEKLDDWKQNKELIVSANKNAQEATREDFKAKIEMAKLLKDNKVPGADQAYQAMVYAQAHPEDKAAQEAAKIAREFIVMSHPAPIAAGITAAQSGANNQSNNDIKAQIANMQNALKQNEDAAKAVAKIRITPEYSNATRAEQFQMEANADASARKGVNTVQVSPSAKGNPAPSVAPSNKPVKVLDVPKNPSKDNLVINGVYPLANGGYGQWTGTGFRTYTGSVAQ